MALEDMLDNEEDLLNYHTGKISIAEAFERGIIDEHGVEILTENGEGTMDDPKLVKKITEAVRQADHDFETVGGSSRHWVRDCLLARLEEQGLTICEIASTHECTCTSCDHKDP